MAITLTDEMAENVNAALETGNPCILAASDPGGWPSIGYRGSAMVYDAERLAYWERSNRDGLANIRKNPKVAVMYRNSETRTGWKFYGRAAIVESGDLRQQVWERVVEVEKERDPEQKGVAVVIEVDRVETYGGELLMEREGL